MEELLREQVLERTYALLGREALSRLTQAHVLVLGVGGVGGHAVEALARAGIGHLTLVDDDVFSPSNLNRQRFCTLRTLGQPKVAAAAEELLNIAPFTEVTPLQMRVTVEGLFQLFGQNYDYVIDAIDDVPVKVALAQYCETKSIALISSMGTGNRMGAQPFQIGDIYATQADPLARAMRTRLRKLGVKRLTVCWSAELPCLSSREGAPASISYVPAMAGLTLAGYVVRALQG